MPSLDEPRTRGQKAADEIITLLHIGVDADPNAILGHDRPAIRIAITEHTLNSGHGHGRIEASPDPISFTTVQRHLCTDPTIAVMFDADNQIINMGRERRLFTRIQRIGMALRDGGCRMPGCDRPASWTEAHHITHWKRDHGKTDIADGILLCRLHHLLIHTNKWDITRNGGTYWLIPPPTIDPQQHPHHMPSKEPLMRELQDATGGTGGTG